MEDLNKFMNKVNSLQFNLCAAIVSQYDLNCFFSQVSNKKKDQNVIFVNIFILYVQIHIYANI